MVGREAELAHLEGALAAARTGTGRTVIVSGEAGIGKSRLVREVAGSAQSAGMRLLVGRAVQTGTPVPYRPFSEAMQSGVRKMAEIDESSLDPYRPALRRLLPAIEQDALFEEEASPVVLMEGLLRLLTILAADTGLLLVVEDLHWADADSLAVAEYLADHSGSLRALCLYTERTDSSDDAAELVVSLTARRAAERIVLEPLSDHDVVVMAGLILGQEGVPAGLTHALAQRAAGVPFLVEETLSAYLAAGGPAERTPEWWISRQIAAALPPSYRQVVAERLATLDVESRRVVSAAAVLGRSFDWRLLEAITGLEEDTVSETLRAAAATGLVSSRGDHSAAVFEFRHALAREAVLAEMPPHERASVSLRAARAIEASYPGLPGEWCQRAGDLFEEAGDRLRACGLLLEAAQRALLRSAFQTAEHILAHARHLAGDDWMVWMRVDDLLLEVLSQTGKAERVLELGYGLIHVYEGRYRSAVYANRLGELHLRIARGIAAAGEWDRARLELEEARRLAEQAGDGVLLARTDALSAQAALAVDDVPRALVLAAAAERSAARLGLGDVLCEALDAQGRAAIRDGDYGQAVAVFERCGRAAELHGLPLWRVQALLELGIVDSVASAKLGRLVEARDLAAQIGAVSALAAIELQLAWAYLGQAELQTAGDAIERCLELSRPHGLGLLSSALAATCMLHALRDEPESLERSAAEAVATHPTPLVEASIAGNGRALHHLVQGDELRALELLDRIAPIAEGAADWTLSWLFGLRTLLRAALGAEERASGSSSHANPLTAAYLIYAHALTLGREGRHEDAVAMTADADATMPPGWRRAHARLVVARSAFEAGWGDPGRWIRESLTFLEAPLPRFAAACKASLRRAGVPVPRRGRGESPVPAELQALGVTSREMDVFRLVGERLSNRDIAAHLYLSPRTIEDHVASLKYKLNAGSRRELGDLAARHQGELPAEPGASRP